MDIYQNDLYHTLIENTDDNENVDGEYEIDEIYYPNYGDYVTPNH